MTHMSLVQCVPIVLQDCQVAKMNYPATPNVIGSKQDMPAMLATKKHGKAHTGDKTAFLMQAPHSDVCHIVCNLMHPVFGCSVQESGTHAHRSCSDIGNMLDAVVPS